MGAPDRVKVADVSRRAHVCARDREEPASPAPRPRRAALLPAWRSAQCTHDTRALARRWSSIASRDVLYS